MSNDLTTSSDRDGAGQWKILLISDNLVDQKLLQGLLVKHRHQVTVISDGHTALLRCAENEFDVVILDDMLSAMDGVELVTNFRKIGTGSRRMPIIVLGDDESDGNRCLQAGADACLSRPLQMDEFHESVREARQPDLGEEPAESNSHIVNWQVALDAVGGRRDLLAELVDIFHSEYPQTLSGIQQAIERKDPKQLQMSAHQLKGCLRYFGTTAASDLARRLEDIGRSGNVDGAANMVDSLSQAVERLWPELRKGPD